jgi:ferredoxin
MQKTNGAAENFTVDKSICTGCFNCQLICSITYEDTFYPERARLSIERVRGETLSIQFEDNCTLCGLCAKYCMYGALTFRKES